MWWSSYMWGGGVWEELIEWSRRGTLFLCSLSPLRIQWSPFLGARTFKLFEVGVLSNPSGKDLISTVNNAFTLISFCSVLSSQLCFLPRLAASPGAIKSSIFIQLDVASWIPPSLPASEARPYLPCPRCEKDLINIRFLDFSKNWTKAPITIFVDKLE